MFINWLLDRFEAADVIKAQKFLLTEHLQLFIENLDQLNLMPIDSSSFTSLLHEWGINIRHLGKIIAVIRAHLAY